MLFCSGIAFLEELNIGENYLKALIIIFLALTSSGLLLYAILNIDNFKRIKGSSKEENRKYVELLCENFNWKLQRHSKERSIISFSADLFSWSREIVFIYDKTEILVNVTSFGLFKTKSPFHWFADRKTENKIEKEIFNSINNDMPTTVIANSRQR